MRASAITGRLALAGSCLASLAVPATASAPASPGVTPSPSALQPCAATDLKLTVGAANGAAGTIFYPLDFTNTSGSACTMYGYPGVAFVSSPSGSQIGAPASRRTAAAPTVV